MSSGRNTAVWQSNFVIDQLLGFTDLDRYNLLFIDVFHSFQQVWIMLTLLSPCSTKADVE